MKYAYFVSGMLNCGTVNRSMFVELLVVGENEREIYLKWPKRFLFFLVE
jgi:hypothetical protein